MDGGKEANGTPLYIARVKYSGGVHTAKVGTHLPGAQLAFSGTEVTVEVWMLWSARSVSDTPVVGLRGVVPPLNGCVRVIHIIFLFVASRCCTVTCCCTVAPDGQVKRDVLSENVGPRPTAEISIQIDLTCLLISQPSVIFVVQKRRLFALPHHGNINRPQHHQTPRQAWFSRYNHQCHGR